MKKGISAIWYVEDSGGYHERVAALDVEEAMRIFKLTSTGKVTKVERLFFFYKWEA